ncbi:unnamed protein product [Meloidogyne enterolobii]|uniref:Uncharacterized protein n=1 Tax=Meloidogyne enterolobii TaxID=390850 RepID=A0ACB0XTY2_MELEN
MTFDIFFDFFNLVGRLFRFLKFFGRYFFDKYRKIPNIEKYRKRQNFLGRYFFDNIEKYISKNTEKYRKNIVSVRALVMRKGYKKLKVQREIMGNEENFV